MAFQFGPRRGVHLDTASILNEQGNPLSADEVAAFEAFDLIYRSVCGLTYNYVPMSGHPGGSISSGRFVATLLFDSMEYDFHDPDRSDADLISYAAGHKALGLYAMWALRNEVARVSAKELLPTRERYQLRLEDLLGFRRNPVNETPLFRDFTSKPLDGHPTPATPFVRLATGASGVGLGSSLGLALGARDYFGENAPRVHIIEGEGGLTPGRVAEAMAAAGTIRLDNAILHIDWNQASIDSNHVCRDGDEPGDYVQWNPMELAYLHDWNVIEVADGMDFQQIVTAQRKATALNNGQPTAIVYRTVKGWQYGIEGKASHGAGHKLCSDAFFEAGKPLFGEKGPSLPTCCDGQQRCQGADGPEVMEQCFWEALELTREQIKLRRSMTDLLGQRLKKARESLNERSRKPREGAPDLAMAFEHADRQGNEGPSELRLEPGSSTTLRSELGRVLEFYNEKSGGAFFVAAADLLDSTSVSKIGGSFPGGYFNTVTNPNARRLSIGGICEDAIAAFMSGLGCFGHHIGVASSYGAFIAPLGHVAARLHCIGNQARRALADDDFKPMVLVCAHAGLKTGEDGPTHADPQALQLLQENFPPGTGVTLTPWDPQELWPLMTTALRHRYALIAPFVTRPSERVPDRAKLGLAPARDSAQGVYLLRDAKGCGDGTIVLQGSGVTMAFVEETLPRLEERGVNLNVYYVASAELFAALDPAEQERIFPVERAEEAMGITGFTLPTMYRWIRSDFGRALTLHPFGRGHYLGSGQAHMVMREAGLDGDGQLKGIRRYLDQTVHA